MESLDVQAAAGANRRPGIVACGITLLTAIAVAGALLLVWHSPEPVESSVSWPVLALLFGASEAIVLHVQVRREAETLSLSDIPFVLGLLFTSPEGFLAARLIGPLVVFVIIRRQALFKTAFNVALQVAGAALGYLVYHLVGQETPFPQVAAVLAVYAGVAAASLLETLAIQVVVASYEGVFSMNRLARDLALYLALATVVATFGIVAAFALLENAWSALFLIACAVVLAAVYRRFATLIERHNGLERLYHFSRTVTAATSRDEVLRHVLEDVQEIATADLAELYLLDPDVPEGFMRSRLDGPGRVTTSVVSRSDTAPIILETVHVRGRPLLLRRGERDPVLRDVLEQRGHRDSIIVPLRGEAGVIGALAVADRAGEVRGFDEDDQLLLETAAAHTTIALQKGRLVEQLRHEASHDRLTGLANRQSFERATEVAILQALSSSGRTAVMVLDIDGFKDINETLGHRAGDLVLREVARRLLAAGGASLVARMGADEYAVLVPDVLDGQYAVALARRLLSTLDPPVDVEGAAIALSASVGVAIAPDHGREVHELLKRADFAKYAAKSAANAIVLAEDRHENRGPKQLTLLGDLRRALEEERLDLHVQPKATLSTGTVEGVEALSRWYGPSLHSISAEDFIPMVERSGLIGELTRQVLDAGLRAQAVWLASGRTLSLAINLSPRSLLDETLPTQVADRLGEYGVPPSLLTLEITESSVMADPPRTVHTLHALRDLGLRLSVDDFGTGYSSLSYLKRLPVDEVKIDKSFVLTMDRDPDNESIVRAIVDLSSALGLRVVAEGVETVEVWRRLRMIGCQVAQGFILSKPMPVAAFDPWLQTYEMAPVIPESASHSTLD